MTTPAPLMLFDSLTRSIAPFRPIDPATTRIYSCGPTVYGPAHLGNLRAYVFTDTLRRVLNWKGHAVNHVVNITDVGHLTSDADAGDDKMEAAATRAAQSIWEVAAHYTAAFKADLARLDILPPTLWSTATDHIQEMIAFARAIEAHGAAYEIDGLGLYFDVSKVPSYGQLARATTEAAQTWIAEGRIDLVEDKRNAADFALWRTSAPGEARQMEWASPWGLGAPGWHLECSVMSMKYLGAQFDIHTGGIDHREIHHPNEIAQNQAYTCSEATGANIWMHNNFLVERGGKMSKSAGVPLTLQSVIDRGVHPLAYRMLCLSAHYRSELEYSPEALGAALVRLKRLVGAVEGLRAQVGEPDWLRVAAEARDSRGAAFDYPRSEIEAGLDAPARERLARFDADLADDLMTPRALPTLEAAVASSLPAETRLRLAATMDLALGLDLLRLTRADLSLRPADATLTDAEVGARLAERSAARARRDFAEADRLRDLLAAAGVELMDGSAPAWSWQPRLD